MIIVAGVVAGGIRLAAQFAEKGASQEHMKTIIGTFLMVALLLLMAEFSPKIARGLSVVIVTTSVVMNGKPFLLLLKKITE